MENPIQYSDFIQPDSSITDLIKQLEQLETTYLDMLKAVKDAAVKTEAALKKNNNTTTEGQETTKKAATEAEKLAKTEEQLVRARSNNGIELAKAKKALQEQNQLTKLELKRNEAKEGSYNRLSAQYSLNVKRLNAMSKAQREGTKAGKALEKETKALYTEMKRMQSNTGAATLNVGNYGSALDSIPGRMGQVIQSTKRMGKQFLKLAANPIVLIIAAIVGSFVALRKAMQRSEEGQDRLNRVSTVMASIFDNIMDILTELGVALFDSFPKILQKAGNFFTIFAKKSSSWIYKNET